MGSKKTATDAEIRKAYRKLAKEHHPDLNSGNKEAEARFKEIAAANTLLSDPEKRRAFDAGENRASGQPQAERRFYRDYAGAGTGFRDEQPGRFGRLCGFGRHFAEFAQGRHGGQRGAREAQKRNSACAAETSHYALSVEFLEAVNGAKKRVDMPDGKTLDIAILLAFRTAKRCA